MSLLGVLQIAPWLAVPGWACWVCTRVMRSVEVADLTLRRRCSPRPSW